MTASQRGRLIWKLADLLEQYTEEFAQLKSLDNGKPLTVARVADVPLSIDLFRYMAGWATKIKGNTIPISMLGNYFAYTLREPIGVVGQIIPWNFPLLMAAWKLDQHWRRAVPSSSSPQNRRHSQRCDSVNYSRRRVSLQVWSTSFQDTAETAGGALVAHEAVG